MERRRSANGVFVCVPEAVAEASALTPLGASLLHMSRFTAEEDEKLRGWVADHPDIKVKGNKLWEKAEREKLLPGRTYQAMRERFTKHVRRTARRDK